MHWWNWAIIIASGIFIGLTLDMAKRNKQNYARTFRACEQVFRSCGDQYNAEYSRRYAEQLESGHWGSEKKIKRQMEKEGWVRDGNSQPR